ncbi:hypothetical protein GCM10022420_004660 [Streptomyces iranensis]
MSRQRPCRAGDSHSTVAAVLGRVVGLAVADPVALGQGAARCRPVATGGDRWRPVATEIPNPAATWAMGCKIPPHQRAPVALVYVRKHGSRH